MAIEQDGYETTPEVFDQVEVGAIVKEIQHLGLAGKFGVRQVLYDHPSLTELVMSEKLLAILCRHLKGLPTCIKSIYFDKPPKANWIVNWHQDLTINVDRKIELQNYNNWRTKPERVVVQPDVDLLENIVTLRIRLDDCGPENGALRVIPSSHRNGVIQINDWVMENWGIRRDSEVICSGSAGSVLVMKPLLLHASRRSINSARRRIIHLEFTDQELPTGLKWKEAVLPR